MESYGKQSAENKKEIGEYGEMTTSYRLPKNIEAIFRTYNTAVENGYNHFLNVSGNREILVGTEKSDETLQKSLREVFEKWEASPIPELNGLTPWAFFEQMNGLEEFMQAFQVGSKICDDELPEIFLAKLKSHGQSAVDGLLKIVIASQAIDIDDEAAMVWLMAVKVLGDWKIPDVVGDFVEILSAGLSNELFMEKIRDALVNIGPVTVDKIICTLEMCEDIQDPQEYLLMALSDIGTDFQSERVYRCLKSVFLKMQNKATGALCLGNYGDGRAIPVLRGYLEKNTGMLSKDAFSDIKSAIHMLGGNAEDIS